METEMMRDIIKNHLLLRRKRKRIGDWSKVKGVHNKVWGDASRIWGDVSGISGDISSFRGNVSGMVMVILEL